MTLGEYRLIRAFSLGFGERSASLCTTHLSPMRLHCVGPTLNATKLSGSKSHCTFRCIHVSARKCEIACFLSRYILLSFFGVALARQMFIRDGSARFSQLLVGSDKFSLRQCQLLGCGFNIALNDPRPPFRLTSLERNWHWLDI